LQATQELTFETSEGGKPSSPWKDRLIIPLRTGGKVYSMEGRDYTRKQVPKVLYPKGSPVSFLFNQDNLNPEAPLIVVEGTMDLHLIWSQITKNVTCTFGMNVTADQRDYLRDCKRVVLFIDDDEAGRKSVNLFEGFMRHNYKIAVPAKGRKDAGECTQAELEQSIASAKPVVSWLMREYLGVSPEKFVLQ
jgi:DNA primase